MSATPSSSRSDANPTRPSTPQAADDPADLDILMLQQSSPALPRGLSDKSLELDANSRDDTSGTNLSWLDPSLRPPKRHHSELEPEDGDGRPQSPDMPSTSAVANDIAFGKTLKAIKRFRPETDQLFERFLRATPQQKSILSAAFDLWSLDIANLHITNWSIPDNLSTTLKRYTLAYIFSPNVACYKVGAAQHVMDLLKRVNVSQLPPDTEPAMRETVLAEIKGLLTEYRSAIKAAIKKSLPTTVQHRDIATLCASIVKSTSIQVTVQHYARVAFLRWHVAQYPTIDKDKFWDKVDETLKKYRASFATAESMTKAFRKKLDEDQKKYGLPLNEIHPVAQAKDVEAWQRLAEAAATATATTAAPSVD